MYLIPLLAAGTVALLSLTGVFLLGGRGYLRGLERHIVPIAIGVFLGVVFFELIPETIEHGGENGSVAIAFGFIAFYLLSHLLHTYHHHHNTDCGTDECEGRTGASMLLFGDTIHNLADGIVIATAFLINPAVGIATTIGIALHEIPQEIAEFAVLLRAGYSRTRAALYNLLSASSVILGTIVTLVFATSFEEYLWVLTGLAAGNLLYIAATDLLPDVHEESRESGHWLAAFTATLVGLIGIMLLLSWSHERIGHEYETAENPYEIETMTAEELHDYQHEHNIAH